MIKYFPSKDFNVLSELNIFDGGLHFGEAPFIPDSLIRSSTSTRVTRFINESTMSTKLAWFKSNTIDVNIRFSELDFATLDINTDLYSSEMKEIDVNIKLYNVGDLTHLNSINRCNRGSLDYINSQFDTYIFNDFENVDSSVGAEYYNTLPNVDVDMPLGYNTVHLMLDKDVRPDYRYFPTGDFTSVPDTTGFSFDFITPVNFDGIITVLSPVNQMGDSRWEKPNKVDLVDKKLTYGYSVNAFIVAAMVDGNYTTDAPVDPVDPDNNSKVVIFVNNINIVTIPDRIPLEFTAFNMSIDLDSVAWVFNFTIANQESVTRVKPSGMTVKFVEIDINGDKYECFVGRTKTSIGTDKSTGKVTRATTCVGWSAVKQLSYPYSPKRSYIDVSGSTPSGILSTELDGTGFTGVWGSVDWALPSGVFGYVEKAPLAAISELVQSVGAVINPDKTGDGFSISPRYPISPWNWATSTADVELNELEFFTIDSEWIPASSPDSIYVYGEGEHGVGVKCVKTGTGGVNTLTTVVDKHITDTVAAIERGRIEVSQSGFKEIVPITTYVGEVGILQPQMLAKVNAIDGSVWYGMVVSVKVNLVRNGNAITQSISLERHYE